MQLTITVPSETESFWLAEAAARGENLQTLVEKMLREKVAPAPPSVSKFSDDEFERDMMIFAEDSNQDGSQAETIYSGSYSRADIYAEHD